MGKEVLHVCNLLTIQDDLSGTSSQPCDFNSDDGIYMSAEHFLKVDSPDIIPMYRDDDACNVFEYRFRNKVLDVGESDFKGSQRQI